MDEQQRRDQQWHRDNDRKRLEGLAQLDSAGLATLSEIAEQDQGDLEVNEFYAAVELDKARAEYEASGQHPDAWAEVLRKQQALVHHRRTRRINDNRAIHRFVAMDGV